MDYTGAHNYSHFLSIKYFDSSTNTFIKDMLQVGVGEEEPGGMFPIGGNLENSCSKSSIIAVYYSNKTYTMNNYLHYIL